MNTGEEKRKNSETSPLPERQLSWNLSDPMSSDDLENSNSPGSFRSGTSGWTLLEIPAAGHRDHAERDRDGISHQITLRDQNFYSSKRVSCRTDLPR